MKEIHTGTLIIRYKYLNCLWTFFVCAAWLLRSNFDLGMALPILLVSMIFFINGGLWSWLISNYGKSSSSSLCRCTCPSLNAKYCVNYFRLLLFKFITCSKQHRVAFTFWLVPWTVFLNRIFYIKLSGTVNVAVLITRVYIQDMKQYH